jgi:hypothetical protein
MGAAIDKHKEEMAGRSTEAQNAAAMGEQNKMAEMMAAMAGKQQPKSGGSSGGSSPKGSEPQKKPSSNSTNDAIKKLAEAQKEDKAKMQEQMAKIAKLAKEKEAKTDSESKKEKPESLEGSQKAISTEQVMKLDKFVDDVMASNRTPEQDKALLGKLDTLVEKTNDKNIANIRDDFKSYVEAKSDSTRSVDDDHVQDFSTKRELEDYDIENSFSLNDELPRSEEQSQNLETDSKEIENAVDQDLDRALDQTQDTVEQDLEEQIEEQIQEDISQEIDEILDDIEDDIEVE